MTEGSEPMFKLFLSVELHCKFGKDYFIETHWPFVAPGFELLAGPLKPFSIFCEHVGNNAGVHPESFVAACQTKPFACAPSYFAAAKQSAKHSFATRELRRLDNQNSLRPIHEFDLRAGHQTVLFAHGRRNRDLSFACDSLRKVSLTPAHQVNISPYGLLLFPVHSAFHIQMSLPGSSRLENSSTLKAFVFVILHSALRRRRHHLRGHSNSARALSNCTSPAVPAI